MSILEGQVGPKEFVTFLENKLPLFFQYNLDQGHTLFETMGVLHNEAFCHEVFEFDETSDLESKELAIYLHTLKLAASRSARRLETLYGGL